MTLEDRPHYLSLHGSKVYPPSRDTISNDYYLKPDGGYLQPTDAPIGLYLDTIVRKPDSGVSTDNVGIHFDNDSRTLSGRHRLGDPPNRPLPLPPPRQLSNPDPDEIYHRLKSKEFNSSVSVL